MLFLPHLLGDPLVAATVSGLVSCALTVYNALRYHRGIQWRLILPLIVAALVAIPPAVLLSVHLPQAILRRVLGAVLVVISLYFLLLGRKTAYRPSIAGGAVTGALGGALGGLFSTGGPPVVLYLAGTATDKGGYFASIQVYFAVTNLFTAATRAANGLITLPLLLPVALGIAGCALGNGLGLLVFQRLNTRRFKQIIYIGMLVSGVLMMGK